MGFFGDILGVGASLAGAVIGGKQSAKAANSVRDNIKGALGRNEDWYNRRYNENMIERAEYQDAINKVEESVRNRNKQSAGRAAVGGAAEEAIAAEKEANNKVVSDVASNIAASSGQRKDQVESQAMQKRESLEGQLNQMEIGKANAIGAAAAKASEAGGNLADLVF